MEPLIPENSWRDTLDDSVYESSKKCSPYDIKRIESDDGIVVTITSKCDGGSIYRQEARIHISELNSCTCTCIYNKKRHSICKHLAALLKIISYGGDDDEYIDT